MKGFAATAPADADVNDVAKAIVRVVDMPFGKRPFRVHIDPAQDGAEIVNGVADRVRTEMYHNIGLSDLTDSRHLLVGTGGDGQYETLHRIDFTVGQSLYCPHSLGV